MRGNVVWKSFGSQWGPAHERFYFEEVQHSRHSPENISSKEENKPPIQSEAGSRGTGPRQERDDKKAECTTSDLLLRYSDHEMGRLQRI